MTNSLRHPRVTAVLQRLFAAAAADSQDPPPLPAGRTLATASLQERADAFQDFYLPISAQGGDLLYSLVRSSRPQTIVEFGTSFGISTLYLAAAVTDNGTGHVLTTEMSATKIAAARANLREAGLDGPVTILAGDAQQTLAQTAGPIEFVLLDGWKDLCLPVLHLLEDKLAPGALVLADDITLPSMGRYLDYVRDPANGYVSTAFPVEDGIELSCHTGTPTSQA
jgi:predicted O-methyltransferase YrrM